MIRVHSSAEGGASIPTGDAAKSAGHTPGPWEARTVPTRVAVFAESGRVATMAVTRTAEPHKLARAEANARLIAAAPDLLAFADMVARHYSDHSPLSEEGMMARDARAAISKATGESAQ